MKENNGQRDRLLHGTFAAGDIVICPTGARAKLIRFRDGRWDAEYLGVSKKDGQNKTSLLPDTIRPE